VQPTPVARIAAFQKAPVRPVLLPERFNELPLALPLRRFSLQYGNSLPDGRSYSFSNAYDLGIILKPVWLSGKRGNDSIHDSMKERRTFWRYGPQKGKKGP
jgi:hypothetical protein